MIYFDEYLFSNRLYWEVDHIYLNRNEIKEKENEKKKKKKKKGRRMTWVVDLVDDMVTFGFILISKLASSLEKNVEGATIDLFLWEH